MIADAKGSVDPNITRAAVLDFDAFPCAIPTVSFGLNDFGYQQQLLSNGHNFSERTSCQILELDISGRCKSLTLTNSEDFAKYFKNKCESESSISARIAFVGLQPTDGATFGSQISISSTDIQLMLQTFTVRPEFVPLLLGQFGGNHLPPSHFQQYGNDGGLEALDLICQQPRWGFRKRQWPISTCIRYSESTQCTTCIVSHGVDDERITAIQTRLAASFQGPNKIASTTANTFDPFLLPTMITHECFMQSDSSVFELGNRLYGALDAVDKVAETQYDRDDLASITFKLHQVSQDADSLIQSTDIAISIVDSMRSAQETLEKSPHARHKHQMALSLSSSAYLKKAVEARKRWLRGAKSRKDTTMNLVYNLVSQKEAETSLAIARDTKNDSTSMKAIAALTIVFLPATAVTSFFGTSFFDGANGSFTVASQWWIFLAVAVPLTIALVVTWWLWDAFAVNKSSEDAMCKGPRWLLSRLGRRAETSYVKTVADV